MLQGKLLKHYSSKAKLENFKNKLNDRAKKYGIIGNNISKSYEYIAQVIDIILYDNDNFIKCDMCGELKSTVEITQKFDDILDICSDCIEEHYIYCEECSEHLHCDDVHIISDMYVCKTCYFDIREQNIKKHKIENSLLKKLEKYFNGNICRENMEQVYFKIDGYDFSIEPFSSYIRLGSFSANCWIDICNNEKNIIKAIQYLIDKNDKNIDQIYIKEDNNSICYL